MYKMLMFFTLVACERISAEIIVLISDKSLKFAKI